MTKGYGSFSLFGDIGRRQRSGYPNLFLVVSGDRLGCPFAEKGCVGRDGVLREGREKVVGALLPKQRFDGQRSLQMTGADSSED